MNCRIQTVAILGVPVDNLTMDEAIRRILKMCDEAKRDGRTRHVATATVAFVVNTLSWRLQRVRHPQLLDTLRRADMITADGLPLIWASRLLGRELSECIPGLELLCKLAMAAAEHGRSLYLLGGRGDIAERAAATLREHCPGLAIAGTDAPDIYIAGEQLAHAEKSDAAIIERINQSGADILLISLGTPKQEIWFDRNRDRLKAGVAIGVGSSFDIIAGEVTPAVRRAGNPALKSLDLSVRNPRRQMAHYLKDLLKFGTQIWPSIIYYQYQRFLTNRCGETLVARQMSEPGLDALGTFISLPSRLDTVSVRQVKLETDRALKGANVIALDFRDVVFIDSTGIGFLISAWKQANQSEVTLYAFGITDASKQYLTLNRIWDLFRPYYFPRLEALKQHLLAKTSQGPFQYGVREGESIVSIQFYGRLDAGQIRKSKLMTLADAVKDKDYIINLSGLQFIDSSGIGLLVMIQRALTIHGKLCILCGLGTQIKQVFRITRMDLLFTIVDDIIDAQHKIEDA